METKAMKVQTLDELTDKFIGKKGTPSREEFEHELQSELLGMAIRKARKERNLTQEELGKLVGVQKSQISKIENSVTNARLETLLKVFHALNARISFNVELLGQELNLTKKTAPIIEKPGQ